MNNLIREQYSVKSHFKGSRQLSNFFWALTVSVGGTGFFLTGLLSFLNPTSLFLSESNEILFIPQGIILLFYGTVGLILGIFLSLTIYWNIGSGYNEYNSLNREVILYRTGFPGKNRELIVRFPFEEIEEIKINIQGWGILGPKGQLVICLVDNREIPVRGMAQPVPLMEFDIEVLFVARLTGISQLSTNITR